MNIREVAGLLRLLTVLVLICTGVCGAAAGSRPAAKKKEKKSSVIAKGRTETAMPLNILQEPEGRSVRYLYAPVVSAQGDVLYSVNFLDGSLESWDMATGALRAHLLLPDSLRYFYRTDPAGDTVWSGMESQGFNPARFVSLCIAGNNSLYALATLPAGYTLIPTAIKSDTGAATIHWPQWKWRQLVIRFDSDTIAGMYSLPEQYIFSMIIADGKGIIGGVCHEIDALGRPPGDSSVVMALLDVRKGDTAEIVATWKATSGDVSAMTALPRIADDGTLWYCSPERNTFFTRKNSGVVTPLELRGSLLDCAGFAGGFGVQVPVSDSGEHPRQAFRLRSMVQSDGAMMMLLTPLDPQGGALPVIQLYDAAGALHSEIELDVASLRSSPSTWLLHARNNEAVFLIETSDQRWRLEKVDLGMQ